MKFNKWTLGLAAVGAVSLGSAVTARADGAGNLNPVQAALAGITISGYVDTSIELGLSPSGNNNYANNSPAQAIPLQPGKQDGFNLNVVELNIEKPLDESQWASGFKVQLLIGPDAVGYNTSVNARTSVGGGGGFVDTNNNGVQDPGELNTVGGGGSGSTLADFGIKQAYVALRTPVGNGIDWKIGVFDTIIGYEVFESGSNPNFTRSYGWSIEPTQHTGILGSYKINDIVSVSAGVANTISAGINARNGENPLGSSWRKTYMASVTLTAPESWGWAAGSAFYGGIVSGWAGGTETQTSYYAGAVLKTPVAGLTAGVAFDYADNLFGANDNVYTVGLYASYQATEKLSVHVRGEYGNVDFGVGAPGESEDMFGFTGTIQYNLWANVISRLELRWDTANGGIDVLNSPTTDQDSVGLYANIIYKF